MNKAIKDFIISVNFLVDDLEFMIEEGKVFESILLKRVEVVRKFKKMLECELKGVGIDE